MNLQDEIRKIEESIRQLQTARESGALSPEVAEASIRALEAQKATYQAQLTGGGAIAQNQSTAAGQQAVVAEDVIGSVINTGSVNYFFQRYEAPAGKSRLSKEDFERILREYLGWVVKAHGKARLYGLESMRTTRAQPRRQLADVFIPLTLRRFSPPGRGEIEALARRFEGDPLAAQRAYLQAVEEKQGEGEEVPLKKLLTLREQLAVIGGAGSGKSTLAAYLAASLAQAALEGTPPPFDLPRGRERLLPLLIPLRYLREYQRICAEAPQEKLHYPRTGKLAGFIPWYLMRRRPALELSEDFFDRLLLGGGCLLILDGLDEVVSRAERAQVRAQVETLANDIYPGNLVLVTARESGYREDAVFGEDFLRLDVQPLEDEQIAALVHNWCLQLWPEAPDFQTEEIVSAIGAINRRYEEQKLPRLISTPLMTTMVVSVRWGENELPRERARLYEAAVKVILQAQYLESDEAQKELVNWGGEWEEQRNWLSQVALEMQRGGRDGAAIPEERLRAILEQYPGMTAEKLEAFIQAVRLRGGLFEERAELFQFAHLTFQEFLAARLLAKQREEGLKTFQPYVGDPWWREVGLLLYGFARDDHPPFAQKYLAWLNMLGPEEKRLQGAELAGACLLEIEKPDPDLRRKQAEELCRLIENASAQTTPLTRARAGDILAALGDPRFKEYCFHSPLPSGEGAGVRVILPATSTLGFIRIPRGKFLMGSSEQDKDAYDVEKPQHELDLPYDYWIAKYPVTVAQWRAFVEASGYRDFDQDALRDPDNRPVRWLTWHDALAYCDWLDGVLKAQVSKIEPQDEAARAFWGALASRKYRVTLPSEAEWEKAARGPIYIQQSKINNRIYPWSDTFDPNKANTAETGLGTTTAVGAFPLGLSPYGCLDMSGNVWEWTRTLWNDKFGYPYKLDDGREDLKQKDRVRVVRGGTFYYHRGDARCAYRLRRVPGYLSGDQGFRVVVSPI